MSITFSTPTTNWGEELNVANRNGFVILRDLLGLTSPECWGEIDPATVLRELALWETRVPGAVIPASTTQTERVVLTAEGVSVEKGCRWISAGLPREQLERYVRHLTALAELAQARGEEISWD